MLPFALINFPDKDSEILIPSLMTEITSRLDFIGEI